jgi:thiamine pyrophosphokinase
MTKVDDALFVAALRLGDFDSSSEHVHRRRAGGKVIAPG